MISVSLPSLTTVSGGMLVSSCAALTELSLPSLTTVSGGMLVYSCAALTELSLPNLTTVSGGMLVYSCAALTELTLPNLATVSGELMANCGTGQDVRVYLPEAEEITPDANGLIGVNTMEHLDVYIPKCRYLAGNFVDNPGQRFTGAEIHLGAVIGGFFDFHAWRKPLVNSITVEPGFKSTLYCDKYDKLTPESLHQLIANLGDNTGNDTLQLRLGAANLAKLNDEDIALATAKNYTLS